MKVEWLAFLGLVLGLLALPAHKLGARGQLEEPSPENSGEAPELPPGWQWGPGLALNATRALAYDGQNLRLWYWDRGFRRQWPWPQEDFLSWENRGNLYGLRRQNRFQVLEFLPGQGLHLVADFPLPPLSTAHYWLETEPQGLAVMDYWAREIRILEAQGSPVRVQVRERISLESPTGDNRAPLPLLGLLRLAPDQWVLVQPGSLRFHDARGAYLGVLEQDSEGSPLPRDLLVQVLAQDTGQPRRFLLWSSGAGPWLLEPAEPQSRAAGPDIPRELPHLRPLEAREIRELFWAGLLEGARPAPPRPDWTPDSLYSRRLMAGFGRLQLNLPQGTASPLSWQFQPDLEPGPDALAVQIHLWDFGREEGHILGGLLDLGGQMDGNATAEPAVESPAPGSGIPPAPANSLVWTWPQDTSPEREAFLVLEDPQRWDIQWQALSPELTRILWNSLVENPGNGDSRRP